jgi:hypothetical protein
MLSRLAVTGLLLCVSVGVSPAAVRAVHVEERSDVLSGKEWGSAGAYERIVARVHFTLDPNLPQNRIIRDLVLAPRNEQGQAEFSADLYMLKPRNLAHGNGMVLYEVSNRGGKAILNRFQYARGSRDPREPEDFGDGFLMEQGYTLVWLGWQHDVPRDPQLLRLHTPVITEGGKTITGIVRAEFIPDSKVTRFSLGDREHIAYPPSEPNRDGTLTVRDARHGKRQVIPRARWRFDQNQFVVMDSGFVPGRIYELVYRARDPVVVGFGPAAVRDFISFLKHGALDGASTPLGDHSQHIRHAMAFGISQSGRFLRKFLYDGFNEDEKGRRVFDGVWADVAGGGIGSFNHRFAQPSRDGHPFMNFYYPTDLFPFTDLEQSDGTRSDGILLRARKADVVPRIFYTNGSYEYWGRAASLIHTTPDGRSDAPLAPETRIYFIAGTQHSPGQFPPQSNQIRHLRNPVDFRPLQRALLTRLQEWVKQDKEPPPSRYPRLDRQELVPAAGLRFPKLPGVEPPRDPHVAWRADYGSDFQTRGIVTKEPPALGQPFPALLPQVDADGNEIAGVHMPEIAVPLATFTGWNFRTPDMGAPHEFNNMAGAMFPFALTSKARTARHDSRPSFEERYPSREDYLRQYEKAARALESGGFLLPQDRQRVLKRGTELWEWVQAASRQN